MNDIVDRLKGSPHTPCVDPACLGGFQVCPHDDEEIIDGLNELCDEARREIERLQNLYKAQMEDDQATIRRLEETIRQQKIEIGELRYELNGPRR